MSCSYPYKGFLYWLLFAGVTSFLIFLAWDLGVLSHLFIQDVTRISVLISFVFIMVSFHCAYRSWFLARQSSMSERLASLYRSSLTNVPECYEEGESVIQDYLVGIHSSSGESDKTILTEVLGESLRGSHQVGWFTAGLVIKLGLLGTVVGFVLMLSSMSGLGELDISDIKELMQQMTQGMGVAMNTTMVGLIASMLLGIQLLLIDRCADSLLVDAIKLGQKLVPVKTSLGESDGTLST